MHHFDVSGHRFTRWSRRPSRSGNQTRLWTRSNIIWDDLLKIYRNINIVSKKPLDWDSQSLYMRQPSFKMADRIEGLRTKKVSGLSWTEHAHLCLFCPTKILIGPFRSTGWNTVVTPRLVLHLISPRTVLCTLLELFVYQSSYLSTIPGAVRKWLWLWMESV